MKKILNRIIMELEKAKECSYKLESEIYEELSKEEIISYFDELYNNISQWNIYLQNNESKKIISNYKKYESIISELELCLMDYDDDIRITDISLSYYELGKKLTEFIGGK